MRKLVVVGADDRDRCLIDFARRSGWEVSTWGLSDAGTHELEADGRDYPRSAWLIAPVSGIDDRGRIAAEHGMIELGETVLQAIAPDGQVAAGQVAETFRRRAETLGIRVVSYRQSESFAWQNAVLTAEGAIQAAIGATGYGLSGRPMAVLGYGRVGRSLAIRLQRLGSRVRILDENPASRGEALSLNMEVSAISADAVDGVDIVFNTIPHPVITREWESMLMDRFVFELASAPGGAAPEGDRTKLALRILPGIPGKIAPRRAAEIIWQTIMAD
jgi:dipicolinate synthase subunit A